MQGMATAAAPRPGLTRIVGASNIFLKNRDFLLHFHQNVIYCYLSVQFTLHLRGGIFVMNAMYKSPVRFVGQVSARRLLALALCLALLAAFSPAAAAADYTGHWAQEEIQRAIDDGWLDATDNFRPDDTVTRAEFADILNNAMGFTELGDISAYTDVSPDDPYYEALAIAYAAGYMIGDDKQQFTPNAPLTREQGFIIFSRLLKDQPYVDPTVPSGITDWDNVASWAADEVLLAVAGGFVAGAGDGGINPKGHFERGEVVALVARKVDDARTYMFAGQYTLVDADSVTVSGDNITVTLEAEADLTAATVDAGTENSAILFESGAKAGTLTVVSGASGTKIDMASGSSVSTANLAAGTTITGEGTIGAANITSDGTTIATRPGTVSVGAGLSAVVAGQTVYGTTPSGGGSSGSGGSGGSGGGGTTPTPTPAPTPMPPANPDQPVVVKSVQGVTPPVAGAKAVTSIDQQQFTAAVTWEPALNADGTFMTDTEYTATIVLSPGIGYTLNDISGFSVIDATVDSETPTTGGTITLVTDPYPMTEAIGTPQNVKIAADSTLTWDPVTGATGYKIYRAASKFGTYALTETVADATYKDPGDTGGLGAAYYYKVTAADDINESTQAGPYSRETEFFGPNMYIYSPEDDVPSLLAENDAIYAVQETAQFALDRYALLFKPGDYADAAWSQTAGGTHGDNVDLAAFKAGFYTHIAGLGLLPTDTSVPKMSVTANWLSPGGNPRGNATQNFWRTIENIHLDSSTLWAVSQAAPIRRLSVGDRDPVTGGDAGGNIAFTSSYGNWDNWGSGGFMADSRVRGEVMYQGQQQWLTRNSSADSLTGGQWNMVSVGVDSDTINTSAQAAGTTEVDVAPVIQEKPFLYVDGDDNYQVFVPGLLKNTKGTSWEDGSPAGTSLSIDTFYIAKPDVDTAATINAALASGKNLLVTPGVYHLNAAINITRPGTVVLGMGLATLINDNNTSTIQIADAATGAKVSGIIFDAGPNGSPALLQVGSPGAAGDANNPILLQDLFFRVGGDEIGMAERCIVINTDYTIGDDFWVWRADHGAQAGWDRNVTTYGTVVNGDNVTLYALMCEHFHKYQTLWTGNGGKLYFYQSEIPYDVPEQNLWMAPPGNVNGYASYKVADGVTSHEAYGLGIYGVPINTGWARDGLTYIELDNAIEVPKANGVKITNACTVNLGNNGGIYGSADTPHIWNVVNGVGGPAYGIVNSRPTVTYYCNPIDEPTTFSIPSGNSASPQSFTLSNANMGVTGYWYTTDGSDPADADNPNRVSVAIGEEITINPAGHEDAVNSIVKITAVATNGDGYSPPATLVLAAVADLDTYDLAQFKPVRTSPTSPYGAGEGEDITDADDTTYWQGAGDNTPNQFIIIDLLESSEFNKIDIKWGQQGNDGERLSMARFAVQVSDDDEAINSKYEDDSLWTTVAEADSADMVDATNTVLAEGEGRYVRIKTLTPGSYSAWNAIRSVSIYNDSTEDGNLPTQVHLVSVEANGSAGDSSASDTTKLTLTFDAAVVGLAATDITLGALAAKGDLTGSGTEWELEITPALPGTASSGELTVSVLSPAGYMIFGANRTVTIYQYKAPPTPGQNIALGAAVTASSSAGWAGGPQATVDGNYGTNWQLNEQSAGWIILDLGASYTFDTVNVFWTNADNPSSYTIWYSEDGQAWEEFGGGEQSYTNGEISNGLGTQRGVEVIGSGAGRYIRLNVAHATNWVQVAEIEVLYAEPAAPAPGFLPLDLPLEQEEPLPEEPDPSLEPEEPIVPDPEIPEEPTEPEVPLG
jgi:hypothetical protein